MATIMASGLSAMTKLHTPFELKKQLGWRERLIRFVQELHVLTQEGKLHFSWAVNGGVDRLEGHTYYNCTTFASYVCQLMYGVDLYAILSDSVEPEQMSYETPEEAFRSLRAVGFSSLDHLFGSLFHEVKATHAQFGDLLVLRGGDALGVPGINNAVALCAPPHFWCITPNGLGRGDILSVIKDDSTGIKAYSSWPR